MVLFHCESIFSASEDQRTQWGTQDMHAIKHKSKGAGIMESDFVEEKEVTWVYQSKGRVWISQRRLSEYSESKEGYWTSERFLAQMVDAVTIADIKYLSSKCCMEI